MVTRYMAKSHFLIGCDKYDYPINSYTFLITQECEGKAIPVINIVNPTLVHKIVMNIGTWCLFSSQGSETTQLVNTNKVSFKAP